jgi:PAS domain S-box-containing protein
VVVSARDITTSKAEQIEIQRLAAIVASSESAIISKALDGTITSWNPAAERLYGYTADEILGRSVDLLLPPGQQNDVPQLVAALKQGQRIPAYDAKRVNKNGHMIDVSLVVSPIYDSDIIGISTIATDISDRKQAERLTAEALERQRLANAELERVSRAQREFISVVSHEFRTPLTSIQGFSEMLRDDELDPADTRDFADEIHRNAERLTRMINEMLDLDRMQSGRVALRRDPLDLNSIVRDVLQTLAVVSDHHSLQSDLAASLPLVAGDRDRVVQVLTNLVRNAINYSPAGGTITVSTSVEDSFVHLAVRDEGLGIPHADLGTIFDRYTRVRTKEHQSVTGTGLGLPISKQIVEHHGGRIWVESEVGQGSIFHFTLPQWGVADVYRLQIEGLEVRPKAGASSFHRVSGVREAPAMTWRRPV